MSWEIESLTALIDKPLSGEWGNDIGEINILRTTNFRNDGTLDFSNVVKRDIPAKKVEQKALKPGDTIIEKSGGSPNQPVGRVVYFDESQGVYLCNNFTSVIRPKQSINSKFLFWNLFKNHLTGKTLSYQNKTTGIINLQLERYLKEIQIPLPPLLTQKRIAEILDKADALRKKDQQLLKYYDQLAQSLFIDLFGDPVKNEKGWEVKKLGECSEKIQIGPFGTQLHAEDYINGGIPLINPMHIIDGKISEQSKFSVSKKKYLELKNYYLIEGDVIMGRRGEMGRCALIGKRESGWLCGTGSLFIRPNKNFDSLFLNLVLSSKSIKAHLERSAQGVTMNNLNQKIVSDIPTISPPISLQNQFATQIQNIEQQKEKVKAQLQASEHLFQALLKQAFNGGLN